MVSSTFRSGVKTTLNFSSLFLSDGTVETSPMSVERLEFLRAAMAEFDDPNDIVRESVSKIKEDGVSGAAYSLGGGS